MNALLTAEEVAQRLGVSTGWLYSEVRLGRIPHVKLGRKVRFVPESIDAWVREKERGC